MPSKLAELTAEVAYEFARFNTRNTMSPKERREVIAVFLDLIFERLIDDTRKTAVSNG